MATTVPASALANRARFLRAPGAAGDCPSKPLISAASIFRSVYGTGAVEREGAGVVVERAVGSGMLTASKERITPPSSPDPAPGADYYRDVRNHPDVLATILDTARVTAGYNPATGPGNASNAEAATEQHEAFLRFLEEMDEYIWYVSLQRVETRAITNSSNNCAALLKSVADAVAAALGDTGQGLTERIEDTIRSAAEYVTSCSDSDSVSSVSYQNLNLPAPTGDEISNRDPIVAFCFSIVGMTRQEINGTSKPTTSTSDPFYITTATYRLRSSAIIQFAEWLAGSTVTSARELVAIMNARPHVECSAK